jgi:hypothetical protein
MTKIAVLALIMAGLVATGTPALAGNCGGHCQQMKECGAKVRAKSTAKAQFQAEYNKCMTDPLGYK